MRIAKVLLAALLALLFASAAQAYDCDSIVVDEAKLFKNEIGAVDNAANALIKQGTTVRVYTVQDFGKNFGSLDFYKADVQKNCPSWRSTDGGMRNNLIAFMIEVKHREVAIYFGDEWEKALGNGAEDQIEENVMGPRFRDGEFAQGFINGMKSVGQLVSAAQSPQTGGGNTTIVNTQPPVDYSGVWSAFLWALFTVVVLAGISIFLTRRGKSQEARRAAQQKAQTAKAACANLITGFDTAVLGAAVNKMADVLSPADVTILQERLKVITAAQESASASFARLGKISSNDPSQDNLSPAEYTEIARSFGEVKVALDKVAGEKQALEQELGQLRKDAEEAPHLLTEAEAALNQAATDIKGAGEQGYKTSGADDLKKAAEALLSQAREAVEAKRAGSAAKLARDAKTKSGEASTVAKGLPQRKTDLENITASAVERGKRIGKLGEEAAAAFDKISATYAESSWKTIRGNGTEAEKRLDAAEDAVDKAEAAASMDSQDWDGGVEWLRKAKGLFDEAEQLLKTIIALEKELEDAKNKAQAEIDAAEADIETARAYIEKHDKDVDDGLEEDLEKARAMLADAKTELGQAKPDFIKVVKQAQAANKAADTILAQAQEEHDGWERKRRQVKSLFEEAKRSIRTTAQYINTHASDVNAGAKDKLNEAQRLINQALGANTLDEQIKLAKRADEAADDALAKAENDVEEEDDRISRRRSDDDFVTGVIVGSTLGRSSSPRTSTWGSRSPSRSSSSGHGSSVGFGKSSSGHGFSSGFGRSSSGFGSAGKW